MIRMSGRTSTLGLAALLLAACALFSAAPKPVPIILDTDIGTDIDDAFALALVLRSPELDLLGVTTAEHGKREVAHAWDDTA